MILVSTHVNGDIIVYSWIAVLVGRWDEGGGVGAGVDAGGGGLEVKVTNAYK